MTLERVLTVEEVFEGALARTGPERDRFLDTACGDDLLLRREVLSLLAAHASDPDFLVRPIPKARPSIAARAGQRLGPWELVSLLGEGGMGSVWRARRADGTYEQDVAIKLVRRGLAEREDELVRRFLAERRTLAALEHPAIAHLIDAGTAEDGTPWFAMELVEGEPIDTWCEHRRLPPRERIELFARVCHAVQFAHGKLVAHRDLKPNNVLVQADPGGGSGLPKLLDFGIAKLLAPGAEAEAALTTGPQRLTPAYASPEQFSGEPATAASDVYSLGVVLYRVLTGVLPYELDGLAPHQMALAVCEAAPRKPSQLDPRIDRDVDTIVLKALEKEPARRYASAGALAEDLERYLTGHPVFARPASRVYRFQKLVARNPLASTVLAGALLAVCGFSIWLFVLWQRALDAEVLAGNRRTEAESASRDAGEQRDEAIDARKREGERRVEAEKALDLLRKLYNSPDPFLGDGKDVKVVDVLDRGLRLIADDPDVTPMIEQSLMRVAGQTYLNLGRLDDAERCFRRVLAILEAESKTEDRNGLRARCDLAMLFQHRSLWVDAAWELEQVLELQRSSFGLADEDTSSTLDALARTYAELGRIEEAGALLDEALHGYTERGEAETDRALKTMNVRAEMLAENQQLAEAEELCLRCLAIRHERFSDDTLSIAHAQMILARTLWLGDRFAEAEALYREVSAEFTRHVDLDHDYLFGLHQNLARVWIKLGREDEAEGLLVDVVERETRLLGPEHPATLTAMEALANAHRMLGRDAEAAGVYSAIAAAAAKSLGPFDELVLSCRAQQLYCLADIGRYSETELPLRDLLDDLRRAPEEHFELRLHIKLSLASNLGRMRCFEESEARLLALHEECRRSLPRDHRMRYGVANVLRRTYWDWGRPDRAAVFDRECGRLVRGEPLDTEGDDEAK